MRAEFDKFMNSKCTLLVLVLYTTAVLWLVSISSKKGLRASDGTTTSKPDSGFKETRIYLNAHYRMPEAAQDLYRFYIQHDNTAHLNRIRITYILKATLKCTWCFMLAQRSNRIWIKRNYDSFFLDPVATSGCQKWHFNLEQLRKKSREVSWLQPGLESGFFGSAVRYMTARAII